MDVEKVMLKDMGSLPWVERYRPSSLEDLISHTHIINTSSLSSPVKRYITEKSLPNLLFYGPPGTGKTSTIVACARMMYGKNYNMMVLEVRSADPAQRLGLERHRSRPRDHQDLRGNAGALQQLRVQRQAHHPRRS